MDPLGAPVSFTGTFTDNAGDTHTAQWALDSTTQAGTVNEASGVVSATGTIVYDNQLGVSDGGDPTTTIGGGSIVIH